MILLAVLLMSHLLFAAEQPAHPLQICSSSDGRISDAKNNFFAHMQLRPTLNIPRIYDDANNGHMATVQTLLPVYSDLLKSITDNEPIEKTRALYDPQMLKQLYTFCDDPVDNYMRRHIQSLMAYKYLQHKDLAKAAITFQNALGIAAELDYVGQFGDPIHDAETALGAHVVLQHMHPMYREQSDLAVLGGHIAAAQDFMKQEIARKGPWTTYDTRLIAWLAAVYQERANSFILTPHEYHEVAQRIEQLNIPLIKETFLHLQFEASLLESTPNPAYIDATTHAYTQFLRKKNADDPSNTEYFAALSIAADHGHYPSALTLGKDTLYTAFHTDDAKKAELLMYAEKYLTIARNQQQDSVIADAAAFELAKIPAKNSLKQIEQFEKLLNRLGEQHVLAPRIHAHAALHYYDVVRKASGIHPSLLKDYKAHLNKHKTQVAKSTNPIAHNLLACHEIFNNANSKKSITASDVEKLNNMLAHACVQATEIAHGSVFNIDQIIANYEPTSAFENNDHAALAFALRGYAELSTQDKNMDLFEKCFLHAYTLDPNHPFILASLNGYIQGLFDNAQSDNNQVNMSQLDKIEHILNIMAAHRHTSLIDFFRAHVEDLRSNTEHAIELYKAANMPKGWYNLGKLYFRGNDKGMEPNLEAARQCFDKAVELDPVAIFISAQAEVAGAQGRYQDQYDLLLKTHKILPEGAFAMARLLMSGMVKEPDLRVIHACIKHASALNEKEKVADAQTIAYWESLATCIWFQINPAAPADIKTLQALGQSGLADAYHALAAQQSLQSSLTTDIKRKQIHAGIEKKYLEDALKLTPKCNRTKLSLAKLIMPTEAWQHLELHNASAEQRTALMKICTLYKEIIASEEPSCFVTEAHMLYGDLLACVYTDYKRSEKHLRKAISLGFNAAYLALLKSYLIQKKYDEIDSLMQEYSNFDWQFNTADARMKFKNAEQRYINLIKKRPQSEMPSTAASSSV